MPILEALIMSGSPGCKRMPGVTDELWDELTEYAHEVIF
jgi:hypothetical protein